MSNECYQSLFGLDGAELRARFLDGAPAAAAAVLSVVPGAGRGATASSAVGVLPACVPEP
ncbi:MAG: hypothetical protein HOV87_23780 [Catenulispora sp.]|nr:hypothetical protein [Catenulispora sp.]